jgi:hypothetical protein
MVLSYLDVRSTKGTLMMSDRVISFSGRTRREAEEKAGEWTRSHPTVTVTKSVSTCLTEEAGTAQAKQMWHTHLHYQESSN